MQSGDADAPLPALIRQSPMAMCLTNPRLPDNPVIACNQAFTDLTGYREEDIIGLNCRFLSREPTRPEVRAQIETCRRERRGVLFDTVNYRKDGVPFRNVVMVAPMFDDDGELAFYLGSQVEVPLDRDNGGFSSDRRAAALAKVDSLTPRQREILVLMAQGRLNKQIAHELSLSEKTVKMHRALLLQRLEVATSADAVRLAVEAGL